jgi:electron transport complex protein RnfD
MEFSTATSPHTVKALSVGQIMRQVLYALVPGTLAYVYYFGWGLLFNISIACLAALACEALILALRRAPVKPALADNSAIVTAWLFALALPPLTSWWLTVLGVAFAIVIAKHLYGGLGYNPFNPAMVGYVVLLISFPREMTLWLPPAELAEVRFGFFETARIVFTGVLPGDLTWDAITMATPLDKVQIELGMNRMLSEVKASPLFGDFGGKGWEWLGNYFFLGGIWLIYRKVIGWQIPFALLGSLFTVSGVFYLLGPDVYPSPLFHLFSGGAMLGAFFVATDPVSAATSNSGRLIFGAGVGLLAYVIRTWGGYPDGIAFAVLLMNMAAPTIDYYFQPRVFGQTKDH